MSKTLDLVGQRFGRLVVIKQLPSKNYKSQWLCKCDCGNEHITAGVYLTKGECKSCGCMEKERTVDYTGFKIGMLTVIKQMPEKVRGERTWLCKCECGNEKIINTEDLRRKRVFSCGCNKRTNLKDLTGQRFSRLTVIRRVENKDNSGQACWECKCDCGNTIYTVGYCLRSGDTTSCGCYLNEVRGQSSKTHGMTKTRIHTIWCSMKERCFNANDRNYIRYGQRGITVCDEWKNDFIAFYNWAIANGYSKDLTIDRIDVNGNYCPENCRWATKAEQANNKRTNHYVTRDGVTHTVTEWCEILGVSRSTVFKRIGKGLPEEVWFYKGRLPNRKEK